MLVGNPSAEDQQLSVRRPIRGDRLFRDLSRRTSAHFTYVNKVAKCRVDNLSPIRRNVWEPNHCWRIGKLKAIAPVAAAAPQCAIRIRTIGNPFSIAGERRIRRGNAGKEGNEFVEFFVVANEFASALGTDDKDLLSVAAHACICVRERAISKAQRSLKALEKANLLGEQPEIRPPVAQILKQTISSVWSPRAKSR